MNPNDLIPPEYRDADKKTVHVAATNLIRDKIDHLYQKEPDPKKETTEIKQMVAGHQKLSKHQMYLKQLNDSGLDTGQIQIKWHEYYETLSETEKHEVWREFYTEQEALKKKKQNEQLAKSKDSANTLAVTTSVQETPQNYQYQPASYQKKSTKKVNKHIKQITNNHHVKSLAFGLGMGFLVIFILLFSFFNERFIVPFIRPNTNVSATPIIVDPTNTGPVGPESKIIIPKINLEAPVVYDVPTIEEKAVQAGLERGVAHYATTPNPGEKGNAVIFGHSSGNILNRGKYKFAFLLLKSVDTNDTFIVQKDGKRFVYKIYNKYVTEPTDVSVLATQPDKIATMTLITCDPPGTSSHRLIVQAEQIFPDPNSNAPSSVSPNNVSEPQTLPSNSPSLWQRLFGS